MRRERPTDRTSTVRPSEPTERRGPTTAATPDVLLRNYDFQWGYDVELVAERAANGSLVEKRYYLQPGATRRESGALDPGDYAVRVRLDGEREATTRCRVGDDTEHTILVELGNGAVSVREGMCR